MISTQPGERQHRHTDVTNPAIPAQVSVGREILKIVMTLLSLVIVLLQVVTCMREGSQHQSQQRREPFSLSP